MTNFKTKPVDNHLHIEAASPDQSLNTLLSDSVREIANSEIKSQKFKDILHTDISTYKDSQFINGCDTNFSFDEFLKKLHLAKICLCAKEESAYEYVRRMLDNMDKSGGNVIFGLTPSTPVDFDYLSKDQWDKNILKALTEYQIANSEVKIKLVIETKRFHLLNGIYKENLKLLKLINDNLPQVQLAIGICDNAENTPINTQEIQDSYVDYIQSAQNINNNVQVQIHEFEQYDKKKPLEEFNFIIDTYDRLGIKNATYIHMSHLNKSAKVFDQTSFKKAVDAISRRNDKIVACYSSNICLGYPFILDDADIVDYLLNDGLNVTLGTDDPYPFNVTDIYEEINKVEKHLSELYPDKYEVILDKLISNSIKN